MALGLRLRAKQSQVFRLGQFVSILQMTTADLDEHLAAMVRENPMLILRQRRAETSSATDVLEMTAVADTVSLHSHVFHALAGLIAQGGLMEKLVTALIEELEPSGWLGRPVPEIAETLDVSAELVEAALMVVQKRVDPAGLFARNLQECLRLQLEDLDELSDDMKRVLADLPALESDGVAGLVAASCLDERRVRHCLAMLRQLDPKPGSAFTNDATLMREPDVRISPSCDGWGFDFRASPRAEIEVAALPRGRKTQATLEALEQARALKRALEIRRSALEQVVHAVVNRQDAYFRFGTEALEPMTMSEIAQETGFHMSTVSRVLNGLLIEGPNGIVAARKLFAGTASAHTPKSKPMVQARIRALLSTEDPRRPLSDRRLTTLLKNEGIMVSRRVVSNYRQGIGILPASKRKLRA
ncbi:MAG: RNA polymerase subunit sigma-54 [Rhodobacteraceae bacterium]|nr:RNA polymerase subunit sigma-54 [Paracoccaceae bacterium]